MLSPALSTSRFPAQNRKVWPATSRLQYALYPMVREAMHTVGAGLGLNDTVVDALVFVLGNFDVAPLSAELIGQRMPYKALRTYRRMLSLLSMNDLLAHSERYGYFLTEKARHDGWRLFHAKQERLQQVGMMSPGELHELATLLHRLQHSARVMPGLPDRRWLMARNAYLRHDAGTLARIEAYLSDLNAFRDDCYLHAWQPLGVSGQAWEVLNLLWKRGGHTLPEIWACLNGRGFTEAEYATALEVLLQQRWLHAAGAGDTAVYTTTVVGRQICQQVEADTDAAFYTPWTVLDDGDLLRLESLTVTLAAHLNGRQPFLPI